VPGFDHAQESVGDPGEPQVPAEISDDNPPARGEDPDHFADCDGRIGEMVEGGRGDHRGELLVAEREIAARGDEELDPLSGRALSADASTCPLNHLGREIDPHRPRDGWCDAVNQRAGTASDVE
jgi:hypothetical protein